MSEQEELQRELKSEPRMMQRQWLLKRLRKLQRADREHQLTSEQKLNSKAKAPTH